jgi:hypothetical protein
MNNADLEIHRLLRSYCFANRSKQIVSIGGLRLTPDFTFNYCIDIGLLDILGVFGICKDVNNTRTIK